MVYSNGESSTYWDALCDSVFCFPCTFSDDQIFGLRGDLAGLPNVDTKYLFIQRLAEKGIYTFQGFKGKTDIRLRTFITIPFKGSFPNDVTQIRTFLTPLGHIKIASLLTSQCQKRSDPPSPLTRVMLLMNDPLSAL